VILASSLQEFLAAVSTVFTTEEPSHTNVVRGDLQMATAAKFRIDVAIHDLLMNSIQRSPVPAEAKGLTLPEPIFPQFRSD
jgi:hypothetical protein